jgi:hypothetical protein
MSYRRKTFVVALIACLSLAAAARQRQLSLSGRVLFEAPAKKGAATALPRFTARLYFPKGVNRPTIVTYTDVAGNFTFKGLDAGRYLLEIYQGSEMVYQKALTLDGSLQQPLVITLKPRA